MSVTALAECVQVDYGNNIMAQKSEIGRLSWRLFIFQIETAMAANGIQHRLLRCAILAVIGIRADMANSHRVPGKLRDNDLFQACRVGHRLDGPIDSERVKAGNRTSGR
jgi:hypothetical protein